MIWRFVTTLAYRHVAITVPDLESAEAYYRGLFDLEVITREALTADGDRSAIPLRAVVRHAEHHAVA
jgi:catechol 2,3-dioxygenase-like lactoylglutathione lyase family enzyme